MNNLFEGKGKLIGRDGNTYDGEWHKGKRHGKGIEIGVDGFRYEGKP